MSITPVLVELTPARRIASVTLTNPTDQPKTFQTELLSWSQNDGVDQYAPNDDLIVTPAIAQMGPGQTQVFRVALRSRAQTQDEQAYRLILEDISEDTTPKNSGSSVNLRLRFNLPVMVAPSVAARNAPRWSLCPAPVNKGCVRLDNDGNRRIRLSTISLDGQDGWHQEVQGAGTVLAGSWKQWIFVLPQPGLPTRVNAKGEGTNLNGEFPVPR